MQPRCSRNIAVCDSAPCRRRNLPGTSSDPSRCSEPARNPLSRNLLGTLAQVLRIAQSWLSAPERRRRGVCLLRSLSTTSPYPLPALFPRSLSWNVLSAPSSDHPLSLLRPSSATTLLPTSSDPPPDPPPTLRRGPPRSATATSAVVGGSIAAAGLPFALSSSRFGTGLGGRKHCGGRPAVCRRVERRRGALPLQCRRAGAVPRSRQTSYP